MEPYFYDGDQPMFVVPWPDAPPPPPVSSEPMGKEAFRCERADVFCYVPDPKKKPVQWHVKIPSVRGDVRGVAPRGTVAFSRDRGQTWQDFVTGHPTSINN